MRVIVILLAVLAILALAVYTAQQVSVELESGVQDTGRGRFIKVSEQASPNPPVLSTIISYGGTPILVYGDYAKTALSTDTETRIVPGLGVKYLVQVGDILLAVSVYSGVDIGAVNLASGAVKTAYAYTPEALNITSLLSANCAFTEGYVDLYFSGVDSYGFNYTLVIRYITANNTAILQSILPGLAFRGNIFLEAGSPTGIVGNTVLDYTIEVAEAEGFIQVRLGDVSYTTSGWLYKQAPITVYRGDLIVLHTAVGGAIKAVLYEASSGFSEVSVPITLNGYKLASVEAVQDYIVYKYTRGCEHAFLYLDPSTKAAVFREIGCFAQADAMPADLDETGLPEVLAYANHNYYIVSDTGSKWRVYWDYMLEPTANPALALIGGELYAALVFANSTRYVQQLLAYTPGSQMDETPPDIVVLEPRSGGVYVQSVPIEVVFSDEYPGVCYYRINVSSGSFSAVFSEYYSTGFSRVLELEPGLYALSVEAWDCDGSHSSTSIEFAVVERDIAVLKPLNNTYVRNSVEVDIASSGNYTALVYVNGDPTAYWVLAEGLNTVVVNLSDFPDGYLNLTIRVSETGSSTTIYLIKDTKPPVLRVEGVSDNTAVYTKLVLQISVFDENPVTTTIYLDDRAMQTLTSSGNYSVTVDFTGVKPGYHTLAVVAVDAAGNEAATTYSVLVAEIGGPQLLVNPEPPNNTLVTGILTFNVTCINVSKLVVSVNNTAIYSIDIGELEYSASISINTSEWPDSRYLVVFTALGFRGENLTLAYVWFVDNNPPAASVAVPLVIIEPTGVWKWRNNSYVPVIHPNTYKPFVIERSGKHYFPLLVEISDYWLREARLYVNKSQAFILTETGEKPAVFTVPGTRYVYTGVERDGYWVYELEAVDIANHTTRVVIGAWFDFEKPQLEIIEPVNGSALRNLTLVFRVLDRGSRAALMMFNIQRGRFTPPLLQDYTPFYYAYRVPVNTTVSVDVPMIARDGLYYFSLLAFDSGLNYDVKTVFFILDTTPPRINYTYSTLGGNLTLHVNITDLSGVREVRIYVNSSLLHVLDKDVFNLSLRLEPGVYRVGIEASDKAGNNATVEFTVVITPQIPNTSTPPATSQSPITSEAGGGAENTDTSSVEGGGSGVTPLHVLVLVVLVLASLSIALYAKKRGWW